MKSYLFLLIPRSQSSMSYSILDILVGRSRFQMEESLVKILGICNTTLQERSMEQCIIQIMNGVLNTLAAYLVIVKHRMLLPMRQANETPNPPRCSYHFSLAGSGFWNIQANNPTLQGVRESTKRMRCHGNSFRHNVLFFTPLQVGAIRQSNTRDVSR